MKIECPSCHLSGNINLVDVPAEGRNFECPRCKGSFFVAKPAPDTDSKHLMSMCPVCQYSTFTDEMFAVCPECGTNGRDYQKMLLQKSAGKPSQSDPLPKGADEPASPFGQVQIQHDFERLTHSRRNPDFATEAAPEEVAEKPVIPLPIRITGWTATGAGGILLCSGLAGLLNYYGKDWQALLSAPFLEPVSKTSIFFKYGFFPWLRTLTGIGVIFAGIQFLALKPRIPKILTALCWGISGIILVQEAVEIVKRFLITSGTPSAIFYVDCIISYLIKVSLWSLPFLAAIWLLRRDEVIQEYPEA
jgi:predicted Zn finger-like uncharacterized protein